MAGKESSSPEVADDEGEAERLPRGACVGGGLQEGPSRGREARSRLGTPGSSIKLEEGGICRYVQGKQFIIRGSSKVPQNQFPKPVAGLMG